MDPDTVEESRSVMTCSSILEVNGESEILSNEILVVERKTHRAKVFRKLDSEIE